MSKLKLIRFKDLPKIKEPINVKGKIEKTQFLSIA